MKYLFTFLALFVAFTTADAQTGWEFTLTYSPTATVGLAPANHAAANLPAQYSQRAGFGVHYHLHRNFGVGLGLEWHQLQFRRSEQAVPDLFQYRDLHYARIPLYLSTDWHLVGPIYGYGRLQVHLGGLVGQVEPTPPSNAPIFRSETGYHRFVLGTGVEMGTRIELNKRWSLLIAVQLESNLTPLYRSPTADSNQPSHDILYLIDLYPPSYFSLGGTIGLSHRLGAS